jgi:hypothetical protein
VGAGPSSRRSDPTSSLIGLMKQPEPDERRVAQRDRPLLDGQLMILAQRPERRFVGAEVFRGWHTMTAILANEVFGANGQVSGALAWIGYGRGRGRRSARRLPAPSRSRRPMCSLHGVACPDLVTRNGALPASTPRSLSSDPRRDRLLPLPTSGGFGPQNSMPSSRSKPCFDAADGKGQ